MSGLTLRRGYAWLISVASIFCHFVASDSSHYNVDVGAQAVAKAYLFSSLGFGFRRGNLGHLERSSGRQRKGSLGCKEGSP